MTPSSLHFLYLHNSSFRNISDSKFAKFERKQVNYSGIHKQRIQTCLMELRNSWYDLIFKFCGKKGFLLYALQPTLRLASDLKGGRCSKLEQNAHGGRSPLLTLFSVTVTLSVGQI